MITLDMFYIISIAETFKLIIPSVLNILYVFITVLKNTFYSRGLYFPVNSREQRDAKIKSSPIICNVRIIEEDMTSR